MFGLFKKKDTGPVCDNKVWMDKRQRNNAYVQAVEEALSENKNVVLLHFFKDTAQVIEELLKSRNVDIENSKLHIFNVRDAESSMSTRGTVARQLKGDYVIYIIEHFPILVDEKGIMKAILDQTEEKNTPVFFVALDDPLMRLFGSERIQEIMGRMGYKDGDCIEHKMISKSIERAQAKLEQSIPHPFDTDSEEDWYITNAEKYEG